MIYLRQEVWDDLPMQDWRSRFFIESYCEALSTFTPHFHQSKLMGLVDLANEVLENIAIFEENDKGKGYLVSSLLELKESFENDEIAIHIFSDIQEIFTDCAKNFNSEKFPRALLLQLSLICKRIFVDKNKYYQYLTERLYYVVTSSEINNTEKGRLTEQINKLTRLYVSFLLNEGYSPTYLYHKSQRLSRKNHYGDNNFSEQLKIFIDELDFIEDEYHVYFGIKTNKSTQISSYESFKGLQIINTGNTPSNTTWNNLFSSFSPDFYFQLSIKGKDYVSAALRAYEYLESELDYLKTILPTAKIEHHSSCYVEYSVNTYSYSRKVHIGLLNNLLTSNQKTDHLAQEIHSSIQTKLDEKSRKALEGVFKKLRFAKETADLEQKLLNLWGAFETLNYSIDGQSIISSIVNYAPKIFALNSIKDRAEYVLKLLSKFNVQIPDDIKIKYDLSDEFFTDQLELETFVNLISCKDDAIKIYDSIKHLDLVNFRLINLHTLLADHTIMNTRIEDTKNNIERHLYRIYKQRNNIVHNGFSDKLNHYVINHLTDYLYSQLLSILTTTKKASHLSSLSLNDIFLSIHLVVDGKFSKVKNKNIKSFSDLELKVII